jgi:predicted dehydrogenase
VYVTNGNAYNPGAPSGYIFVSTDSGLNWTAGAAPDHVSGMDIPIVDPADDRIVYARQYGTRIVRSVDSGATFTNFDAGLDSAPWFYGRFGMTAGKAFLGLTMNCARCHDHKIDPIPQKDYYRLLAFFHNINHFRNGGPTDGGMAGATSKGPMNFDPNVNQQALQMDNFAQCITQNKATIVPGEEGLKDMKVIEAIYRSIASGKREKI